ncbi:nuclear transport factor 2 family protein [Halothiobacillus sp. DCM-1]|uniref:nuclear transport factor 2 family protein n=1 Tax=Halothiobacillus sp. DCM-1 TaxID=3112558 RepID=UPI003248AD3B
MNLPAIPGLEAYVRAFETLAADRLDELTACFAESAYFEDPFNRVSGRAAIGRVFAHGFRQCPQLRFEIEEVAGVADAPVVLIVWRFVCGDAGDLRLHGVSRVVFGADGLVQSHVDYWDPAAQLYERVPLLGALMRAIRRRLAAS